MFAEEFKKRSTAEGLWAAMRWLNAQVPYRYTAIFAFVGDLLHNVCLIDKQNSAVARCEDQPITDSYCIYIRRSAHTFSVEQAASDLRVQDHPKVRSFQCYYGVPLFGPDGKLMGTVCHFDVAPTQLTDGVVSTLDELAPVIAQAAFGSGSAVANA